MTDSDSSELSSVPSEDELQFTKKDGILKFFSKVPKPTQAPDPSPPPQRVREPSPPHEFVLADNPDIAFIVMFRSRFTEAFPKSLPNFGPQELERDVVDSIPGEGVEHLLCALLGLLLNRKQDVKAGHYNRALEEAVQTHKSQWAKDWESKNPLLGGATFTTMSPKQRLTLLRTLILWSLSSSDIIKGMITASYKQNRHEDDLNQPLSVQPWGSDSDRRRYFLIEGLDDTHFRVYRESNYTGLKRTWWSVAGDIDELKLLAGKLEKDDGGPKAKTLSAKMMAAVPRFEATEEKRKRREYRQARKQQFKRPEPNYSLYEGRTRGKRIRYTYSDEDDEGYSDATTSRRSARNTGTHTPAEGPTVTLSGRQVKSRQGGAYGESMLSGAHNPAIAVGGLDGAGEQPDDGEDSTGRPRRAAASKVSSNGWTSKQAHIEGYNSVDEMDSDEDDASEQDYGDDEEDDDHVSLGSDVEDQDDLPDIDEGIRDNADEKQSLMVKLPVKTPTPERQVMVKLRLTPESLQPAGLLSAITGDHSQVDSSASTTDLTQPSLSSGSPIKPVDVPASLASQPPQSPLTFRGSPEKPHPFPPSINVGYGAS